MKTLCGKAYTGVLAAWREVCWYLRGGGCIKRLSKIRILKGINQLFEFCNAFFIMNSVLLVINIF